MRGGGIRRFGAESDFRLRPATLPALTMNPRDFFDQRLQDHNGDQAKISYLLMNPVRGGGA